MPTVCHASFLLKGRSTMTAPRKLLLVGFVTACAWLPGLPVVAQPAPAAARPPMPVANESQPVDASTYRVGPEDLLEISVWREDALKKEALVRPDGGISYPLVGEVQAAGKTVLEIRNEIARRLEPYIPEPVVTVSVVKIGSQRVYVLGKVNKPGDFPVGRYVDVLQALSMAGGPTAFADSNEIRIVRREGEREIALPFEYGRVVRGQKLEQNIRLRAGDVVVVP
jgi:polysaccharide export outer membrane protein